MTDSGRPRVLALIPIKPQIHPRLRAGAIAAALRMPAANPRLDVAVRVDDSAEPAHAGDCRPWSKVARVRNRMLDAIDLGAWDYLLWIDADVTAYPADMPTRLIDANPLGITSPMVYVEGTARLYDWAALILAGRSHIEPANRSRMPGRNIEPEPPHWPDPPPVGPLVDMDCTGTVYVAHADIFRTGVRFEDHKAFTDHFPICAKARDMGRRVCVHRHVVATHADLPAYGEAYH
jgi:hypothetical protein